MIPKRGCTCSDATGTTQTSPFILLVVTLGNVEKVNTPIPSIRRLLRTFLPFGASGSLHLPRDLRMRTFWSRSIPRTEKTMLPETWSRTTEPRPKTPWILSWSSFVTPSKLLPSTMCSSHSIVRILSLKLLSTMSRMNELPIASVIAMHPQSRRQPVRRPQLCVIVNLELRRMLPDVIVVL